MSKRQYPIRNWKHYNESLVQRGSLTIWFDETSTKEWYADTPSEGKGRSKYYSDVAIISALTIRAVYHLTLRMTQGMVKSLLHLLGLSLRCPDYSTLCRRQKDIEINLPKTLKKGEKINVVFDATGLKVYGEGEWKVRQHGYSKRRTWRKLSLSMDVDTQEILRAVLSTNDCNDKELLPDLIANEENLGDACGDSGYDSHLNYELLEALGANPLIPPRYDAKIKQHGNSAKKPLARDQVIRQIRKKGLSGWKKAGNYHRRSLVETAMFRLKKLFGGHLANRLFDHQATEAFIRCRALNIMTQLGMPAY